MTGEDRSDASGTGVVQRRAAPWGEPIAALEARWTHFESRLLTFVLLWLLFSLLSWVLLSGLSAPPTNDNKAGIAFRAVIGAVALGTAGWLGARRVAEPRRQIITVTLCLVGIFAAPLWRSAFVDYFDNVKGWLQEGSFLTLLGGLRGVATRLTLWLALLGASLATSAGKHIHIDVIFRFLPTRFRLPAAILNYVAAATMCVAGTWGFIDHISIESYGANAEDSSGQKVGRILHHMGDHAFLARKQIGLDVRSLPHVISGARYDTWMTASEWNQFVNEAGFRDRFSKDQVDPLLVPNEPGATHPPLVISPDGTSTRGILAHDFGLVFPFGLLLIGIRFLIRALLSLSGHLSIDPDEAHREDFHQHDTAENA